MRRRKLENKKNINVIKSVIYIQPHDYFVYPPQFIKFPALTQTQAPASLPPCVSKVSQLNMQTKATHCCFLINYAMFSQNKQNKEIGFAYESDRLCAHSVESNSLKRFFFCKDTALASGKKEAIA